MPEPMELLCTACGWSVSCGPTAMLERLRAVQMLRPGAAPDPELLPQLFIAAAAKSTCPDCGRMGLAAIRETQSDDEWPGARPCEGCGEPIGQERLLALPGARRCARCQQADESGQSSGAADYCPRCGSIMQLKPTRSAGLTRYALFCPACRR
jgi:hypothetical protein